MPARSRACPPSLPPAAAPMRDYSGVDSLVSPLASLTVMLLVVAFEHCFPNADLLFFVPKVWRGHGRAQAATNAGARRCM